MVVRRYNVAWKEDPDLASWIAQSVDGEEYTFCKFCNENYVSHKGTLKRHATSKSHLVNAESQISTEVELLTKQINGISTNEHMINNVSAMPADETEEILPADSILEKRSAIRENKTQQDTVGIVTSDVPSDIPECDMENTNGGKGTKRKFLEKWKINPGVAKYIQPVKATGQAWCTVCNRSYGSKKDSLDKHLKSEKHMLNCGQITSKGKFDEEVAIAEIRLAAMSVDRNVSFCFSEDSLHILQDIIYDSELLKKISLDRKKSSAIVQNVIAPAQKQRLTKILQTTQFSVLIDECTDISVHSAVCIIVRYTDIERKKVCDTLWDVVPAYEGDEKSKADADYVFNVVVNTFKNADISTDNIISFCSDTCNLMMGKCSSISTRFQALVPNIKIVKCACHLEHLVARDAVKVFPSECLDLLSSIYNYISASSKRMHNWFVLQQKLNLEPLVMLRHTPVRWLSVYLSILRILRRFTAFKIFFQNECAEINNKSQSSSNDKTAEGILMLLEDPLMLCYLLFLEAMLARLTRANEHLQSEKAIVPKLNNRMTEVYIEFLKMYMNEDYVNNTDILDIDPDNYNQFKEIDNIYIGRNTQNFFNSIPNESQLFEQVMEFKDDFRKSCRKFLIECCTQIKERCHLEEDRHFFHHDNALSRTFHDDNPNLEVAFVGYPHVKICRDLNSKNTINDQWLRLVEYKFPEETLHRLKTAKYADEFWFVLKSFCEAESNALVFEKLADFALTILCIPHSSATPERVWSKLKNVKTKNRNRLSFPMVRAVLLAAQYVKDKGGAVMFQPTEEMIEAMKISLNSRQRKVAVLKTNSDGVTYGDVDLTKTIKQRCQAEELMFYKKYADMSIEKQENKSVNFVELIDNFNNKEDKSNFLDNFTDCSNNNVPLDDINNNQVTDLIDVDNKASLNSCESTESLTPLKKIKMDDAFESEKELSSNCSAEHSNLLNSNVHKKCNVTGEEKNVLETLPVMFESDLDMQIMSNGLMSSIDYYMRAKEQEFTVGRYSGKNNHPIRDYRNYDERNGGHLMYAEDHKFLLFSNEYQTLKDQRYIDGDVIDAFGTIKEKKWRNAFFVPTQQTKLILVRGFDAYVTSNWFMYHLKNHLEGKMIMPYQNEGHWCLFIIDIEKKTLTHLDPFYKESEKMSTRSRSCVQNFFAYLRSPFQKGWNNLKNLEWNYVACSKERKLQTDGFSCAAFVMHYMDCIGQNIDFDLSFDPIKYRKEVAELLIHESENMQEICLYCFRNQIKQLKVYSILCERFAHKSCIEQRTNHDGSVGPLYICYVCTN